MPYDIPLDSSNVNPFVYMGDFIVGVVDGLQSKPESSMCKKNVMGLKHTINPIVETFLRCVGMNALACSEISEHTMMLVHGIHATYTFCKIEELLNRLEDMADPSELSNTLIRLFMNERNIVHTVHNLEQAIAKGDSKNTGVMVGTLVRIIIDFNLN